MSRADDLAPMLAPAPGPDLGFRSGTVLTWNRITGENTLEVGGATLTDVPILNNSETVNISPGDVVGLIRFQSTYFIAGRIIVPGTETLAASAVKVQRFSKQMDSFAIPNAGAHMEIRIPVPAGYTWLSVVTNWAATARNDTAAGQDYFYLSYPFTALTDVQPGYVGQVSGSWVNVVYVAGEAEVSAPMAIHTGNNPWGADPFNRAYMDVLCIWTRDN